MNFYYTIQICCCIYFSDEIPAKRQTMPVLPAAGLFSCKDAVFLFCGNNNQIPDC